MIFSAYYSSQRDGFIEKVHLLLCLVIGCTNRHTSGRPDRPRQDDDRITGAANICHMSEVRSCVKVEVAALRFLWM